ncbi:hypothetical protein M407DRAFT_77834 [Tulasnella calospora MUT 4182]|uniref:Helitron helicase-like domain-containing protein n=1 Tax=Tulasnella calospora MUT 4182 TaxID=1051891 RepID=A0A0C3QEX1_9AGAM|nr:hypothetical protein M407DRAFT_77834 [Tulasnella calospora MUT 4182]
MPHISAFQTNPNVRAPRLQWNRRCRFCNIPLLTGETSGFCCGPQGSKLYAARPLPPLPAEYNYFINDPNISSLSRKLNLLFSFAALQTTAAFPNTADGFLAVQGLLYHQIRPNHERSGARWILYDGYLRDAMPAHAWSQDIPPLWTDAVANALLRVNPLSQSLTTLSFLLPDVPNANIELRDNATPEIAAIIRHDNSSAADVSPRSLIIIPQHPYGREVKISIPTTSRFWEPLAYPLLFPHGTKGWGVNGHQDDVLQAALHNADVDADAASTQIWYYRRRILGDPRFSIFGRLTSEYVVDMFSRNLETRLHYIRQNQERLRREDAILMDGAEENSENIYLPASFMGSRRWAAEQVFFACLAIVLYNTYLCLSCRLPTRLLLLLSLVPRHFSSP